MEYGKQVSNPMLVGSIELLKAEDTPEHKNMFVNEMMKAKFLAPTVVTPTPEADESGKTTIQPGSKIQFPMLTAPDGKQFFMAFSDTTELKKWKDEEGQQTFALTFDDYAAMLLRKDPNGNSSPASGFVINPFGGNIMISKEMVAGLMNAKLTQMKNAQQNGTAPAGAPTNPQNTP